MQQRFGVTLKGKVELKKQAPLSAQDAIDGIFAEVLGKMAYLQQTAPREGEVRTAYGPAYYAKLRRGKEAGELTLRIKELKATGRDRGTGVCYEEKAANEKIEKLKEELEALVGTTSTGRQLIEYYPKRSLMTLWEMNEDRVALWGSFTDYLKLINSDKYDAGARKKLEQLRESVKKAFMKDMKGALPTAEEWYKTILAYVLPSILAGKSSKDDFDYFVATALRKYEAGAKENSLEPILKKEGGKTMPRDEFLSLLLVLCLSKGSGELHASSETVKMATEGISRILNECGKTETASSELPEGRPRRL